MHAVIDAIRENERDLPGHGQPWSAASGPDF